MAIKREALHNAIKLIEKHKVTLLYAMQTPEFVQLVTGNLSEEEMDRMAERMEKYENGES